MQTFTCNAIIFDLDGVLVDSSAVVEKHWQEWADRHDLDMAQISPIMHGRRAVETMALVAPHLDIEAETAWMEAAEVTESEGLLSIEGAERLLHSLPPGTWGVATSGTRPIALARLRTVGFPIPEVLVTADDVQRGKPAPDAYLMAAEKLGVAPQHCIVFEDAPAGIEAALAAGMRVIALTTSHHAEALQRADVVVKNLSALGLTLNDHLPPHMTLRLQTTS